MAIHTTNYKKHRREKISQCNICLKEAKLSWDHVPPKGGIKLTAVEQEPLLQYLSRNDEERKFNTSQNGVKYRTLCSDCNSKLGSCYDPTLNQFALEIGQILKSKLTLPQTINIKTKPSHLIRSICGHLLAAKNDVEYTNFDTELREFVFDESKQLPENYKVFYWLYPYSSTIIMRDTGIVNINKDKRFGMINTLKYFPVAYMVTDFKQYEGLRELTSFCSQNISEEISIPIDLAPIRESYWPELVDKDNILFSGSAVNSGVYALPKRKNK
ncbi:hypothetical protein NLI92_004269 [Priestia megaterium]|uniref:hypothetical protein n=1 Tax=Priestia megaterium TaxID=1404 RepID=UPI0021AC9768|nr:hypothetical protein [Priestia megaterium]MCR8928846.1 hypothetical protein [Priestia megaterium]